MRRLLLRRAERENARLGPMQSKKCRAHFRTRSRSDTSEKNAPASHERGVALLVVILLVAFMASLAVAVLDDIRFGQRRVVNARSADQARWYAIGAESLARAQIAQLLEAQPDRLTLAGDWNGRVFRFPVEGGAISLRVRDATACFNLNSVVTGSVVLAPRVLGQRQLVALLRALEVSETEAATLVASITDWIDTDQDVSPLGAEDREYQAMVPPYRTSGHLLSEVSELRAIRAVTPALYSRLRPFVCALPTSELSPINVNTLGLEQLPVLAGLIENKLPLSQLRTLLRGRPATGWASKSEFWSEALLRNVPIETESKSQIALTTRFFFMEARVVYGETETVLTSLIGALPGARLQMLDRRWTREE